MDISLQRRAGVVVPLLASLEEPGQVLDGHVGIETGLDVPRAVLPVHDGFLAALKQAGRSDFRDTAALVTSVGDYRSLRAAVTRLAPRRPFGKPLAMSSGIVERQGDMVTEYLSAYAARTPIEAQRHGENAQRILDDLAERAGDLSDWLSRHEALQDEGSVAGWMAAFVGDAVSFAGAANLLELGTNAPQELVDLFGDNVDMGTTMLYAAHRSLVDLFLDSEKYAQKLRQAVALFANPQPGFEDLLNDPVFQHDARRLGLELFDAGLACQQAVESATVPRQAARAVVSFNALVVEAAGRTVAAPIHAAAGTKTKPYSKLKDDDAGDLIRLVGTTAGVPELVAGLDPHLRNAHAHAGITYEDDHLLTDIRSGSRTYAYDDLVDTTFEGWETLLAVHLCLQQHLAVRNLDKTVANSLYSLGLTTQDVFDIFLPGFNTPVVDALLTAGTLILVTDTNTPEGVSPALSGIIRTLQPTDIDTIELHQPDGTIWAIPAAAFTRQPADYATGEHADELDMLRLQREWVNNHGHLRVENTVLRKWVATRAVPALAAPIRDAIARLRQLRAAATALGDPECGEVLTGLTTLVRVKGQGMEPTAAEQGVLSTITGWLEDPAEPVFM